MQYEMFQISDKLMNKKVKAVGAWGETISIEQLFKGGCEDETSLA